MVSAFLALPNMNLPTSQDNQMPPPPGCWAWNGHKKGACHENAYTSSRSPGYMELPQTDTCGEHIADVSSAKHVGRIPSPSIQTWIIRGFGKRRYETSRGEARWTVFSSHRKTCRCSVRFVHVLHVLFLSAPDHLFHRCNVATSDFINNHDVYKTDEYLIEIH